MTKCLKLIHRHIFQIGHCNASCVIFMTTICTGMNKKRLDPSGWVIGISIICTLLPRLEVGSQRLLQGWSPPLETAMKREERGLRVLLALCQGMIAGTWVGSSFWKGLDVWLDMCGWPGIRGSHSNTSVISELMPLWRRMTFSWAEHILRSLPERKPHSFLWFQWAWTSLCRKNLFGFFLHLLEVHLLDTNVDWVLLVDSLMFQRKTTIATTLRMDWSWEKQRVENLLPTVTLPYFFSKVCLTWNVPSKDFTFPKCS